jgi:hypothetical protein
MPKQPTLRRRAPVLVLSVTLVLGVVWGIIAGSSLWWFPPSDDDIPVNLLGFLILFVFGIIQVLGCLGIPAALMIAILCTIPGEEREP